MPDKEINRLVEIMSEMLAEQRLTRHEITLLRGDVNLLREDVNLLRGDVDYLKKEAQKTNLAIGELRLSVMRLAEQYELHAGHEERINALEKVVFK
jgi:hypothetical protein